MDSGEVHVASGAAAGEQSAAYQTRSRRGDRRIRITFPADSEPFSRRRKAERTRRFGIHPTNEVILHECPIE